MAALRNTRLVYTFPTTSSQPSVVIQQIRPVVPEFFAYNVAVQQRDPSRLLPGPVASKQSWRCYPILRSDGGVILPRAISDVGE